MDAQPVQITSFYFYNGLHSATSQTLMPNSDVKEAGSWWDMTHQQRKHSALTSEDPPHCSAAVAVGFLKNLLSAVPAWAGGGEGRLGSSMEPYAGLKPVKS